MATIVLPRLDPEKIRQIAHEKGVSHRELARRAGMTVRSMQKRLYEPLTWRTADRLACALGLHPALVWGDEWWQIQEAYDAAVDQEKVRRNEYKRERRRACR